MVLIILLYTTVENKQRKRRRRGGGRWRDNPPPPPAPPSPPPRPPCEIAIYEEREAVIASTLRWGNVSSRFMSQIASLSSAMKMVFADCSMRVQYTQYWYSISYRGNAEKRYSTYCIPLEAQCREFVRMKRFQMK